MIANIIAEIDKEIAALQKARTILLGAENGTSETSTRRRGRPKGSKNSIKVVAKKTKRVLSAEGRARISAAMKKRHAAKRKAAKKQVPLPE